MSYSLPKVFFTAAIATAAVLPTAESHGGQVFTYSTNAGTIRTFNDNAPLGDHVVGIRLTATTSVTLSSLGFIDIKDSPINNYNDWYHGSNPADTLHDNYQLGIWLNPTSGPATLLGTSVVTPTSVLINDFRYSPIKLPNTNTLTSITIPAGNDFTIAVLLPANPLDAWLIGATHTNSLYNPPFANGPFTVSGAGSGRSIDSSTLTMPTAFTGQGVYSIVNASTQLTPEAPEPASAIFLVGGSAAVLLMRRRRRVT
jgi:hypothetical protein